jgi:hypothetical protein
MSSKTVVGLGSIKRIGDNGIDQIGCDIWAADDKSARFI